MGDLGVLFPISLKTAPPLKRLENILNIYIIIYIETEMQTLTFFADFEAFLDRKALNIWQIRALHQALAQLSLSILKTLLCIGS
jgi:hypothetical protein